MNEAATPPKRTRVSCLPCRQRKSKCDHARPCSSCVLRATASQCTDSTIATSSLASSSSDRINRSHSSPDSEADPSGSQPKQRRTEAAPPRSHDEPKDINDELQRMKHSITRLESLLQPKPPHLSQQPASSSRTDVDPPSSPESTLTTHDYQHVPAEDDPGETGPPSSESRQRWQHLRTLLPPLFDTHRLMHYFVVEADWICPCLEPSRFVSRWSYAFHRQAISDIFAVQVLTLVALSAVFLSDNRRRAIHFPVPLRSLHTKLMKEAVRMVESWPAARSGRTEAETCDLIEVTLNVSFFFRCLSKDSIMARYTERAITATLRAGLHDELHSSWLFLTADQIERRRLIVLEVSSSMKWVAFHCRKEFTQQKSFKVGKPHLRRIGQLPASEAWPQLESSRSFAWRNKSEAERDTARNYLLVGASLANELPALVEVVTKTETKLLHPESLFNCTKDEMRDMARTTRRILARLDEWYTTLLPRAGVGFSQVIHACITSDPVEAKRMGSVLMNNSAVFYMTSILCRSWLLLADRLHHLSDAHLSNDEYDSAATVNAEFFTRLNQRSLENVHQLRASWLPPNFLIEMQAVSAENSRRCVKSIPVLKALQALPSSQFYSGWVVQCYLQSAVNLAIPLVRTHHRRSNHLPQHTDQSTDALRQDIVTLFEAVSQLSENHVARRTAKALNGALRLSGIDQPLASDEDADTIENAWIAEERATSTITSGQMQNAAEGLALLSASADREGSRHSGGSSDGSPGTTKLGWEANARRTGGSGVTTEPMWWETRLPGETSQPGVGSGPALPQEHQLLDELLNFDPSFWQFVLDGTNIEANVDVAAQV